MKNGIVVKEKYHEKSQLFYHVKSLLNSIEYISINFVYYKTKINYIRYNYKYNKFYLICG